MAEGVFAWAGSQLGGFMPFIYGLWPYFLGLAIVGIVAFKIKLNKKFPLSVIVWERRGDDLMTSFNQKLGRVVENGITKWKFKGSALGRGGDTLPPETYELVSKSASSTGVIHLIKYGAGQYKPVDIRDLFKHYCTEHLTECFNLKNIEGVERLYCDQCKGEPKKTLGGRFKIIDADDMNFKLLEFRATMERRKAIEDAITKYAPLIGLALIVVFGMIVAYFGYDYLDRQLSKQVAACQQWNPSAEANPTPTQSNGMPLLNNLLPSNQGSQ